MPNCGPACTFCGRCGKDFEFLKHLKPVNVAPPGVSAGSSADLKEKKGRDASAAQEASDKETD